MRIHNIILPCLLALLLFPCLPAKAQDEKPAVAVTAASPSVSQKALELSLAPLTRPEVEAEAAAWQAILKSKAQEIADLEIRSLKGESGATETTNAGLIELRTQKAELVSRYGIVLDSLEAKGGDVEDGRKYIAAVNDIKTTVNDVGSRIQAFKAWFTAKEGGIRVGLMILRFIGIIIVFSVLARFASKLIERAIDMQPHLSSLLKSFINKMSRRVIVLIGLIVALGTVGVDVGAALALIGGGAFILAFALQDTLSNFANGIMLLVYRPFDVGDAVEIGGVTGKVDSVSLVSTTILTFDNRKVLVPNKKVWGEVITNITGMTTRRVDMIFGIGYSDDADNAQDIIEKVVKNHPLILAEPVPNIGLHELADSSVIFRCWPWAMTSDWLTVRTEVTKKVKEEFDAAGISIPFPQRDVHLYRSRPV